MKGFLSLLALPAIIVATLASPANPNAALVARGKVSDDEAIIERLFDQVKQHDAVINKTLASINAQSTEQQNVTAANQITNQLDEITKDIEAATAEFKEVASSSEPLDKRQGDVGAGLGPLNDLLGEIGSTLAGILAMGNPLTTISSGAVDRLLGALTKAGGPLSDVIAGAPTVILGLVSKILGSI